ncbi:MAG: type II toxin-antitoxin system ParD family antitoxin [Bryobacterales bacterium]|nr:type II toxin-antitoxin system ParD family antitoxin [Bryobacterales bacterium]
MPTRNVNLTEHLDSFVKERIASGRFSNASEVFREGLRLLEQRHREDELKLQWLRAAVQEGIDDLERGDYIEVDSTDELNSLMDDIRNQAVRRAANQRDGKKIEAARKVQSRRSA